MTSSIVLVLTFVSGLGSDAGVNMSSTSDTSPGLRPPIDYRPRVLVVDGEADVVSTIARGLREVASHVSIAGSAKAALERLGAEPVDVVISDVHMPDMTGLELVSAVQARDLDIPVILVTGDPNVQTAVKALEVGAYRYLTKPVEIPMLRTTRGVRQRQTRRGAHATSVGACMVPAQAIGSAWSSSGSGSARKKTPAKISSKVDAAASS